MDKHTSVKIAVDPVLWNDRDNLRRIYWLMDASHLLRQAGYDYKLLLDGNSIAVKTRLLFPELAFIEQGYKAKEGASFQRDLHEAQQQGVIELVQNSGSKRGYASIIQQISAHILNVAGDQEISSLNELIGTLLMKCQSGAKVETKQLLRSTGTSEHSVHYAEEKDALKRLRASLTDEVRGDLEITSLLVQLEKMVELKKPRERNGSVTYAPAAKRKEESHPIMPAVTAEMARLGTILEGQGIDAHYLEKNGLVDCSNSNAKYITPAMVQMVFDHPAFKKLWTGKKSSKAFSIPAPSVLPLAQEGQREIGAYLSQHILNSHDSLIVVADKHSRLWDAVQPAMLQQTGSSRHRLNPATAAIEQLQHFRTLDGLVAQMQDTLKQLGEAQPDFRERAATLTGQLDMIIPRSQPAFAPSTTHAQKLGPKRREATNTEVCAIVDKISALIRATQPLNGDISPLREKLGHLEKDIRHVARKRNLDAPQGTAFVVTR